MRRRLDPLESTRGTEISASSPLPRRDSPGGHTPRQIHLLSRLIICAVVAVSMGTLFWQPSNPFVYLLDVLLRTYVIFIGTVMAHEGTHGHLGRTKAANFWWGRLALLPSMVPFANFRKTHNLHHLYTNIPDKDPDYFMKPRHPIEIPLRAVAMPHHWFFWLRKRGRMTAQDVKELVLNYVGIFAIYGTMLPFVGTSRLIWGMLPPLILVSILLWYPFAFKTHEGFSTRSVESSSHNYYGWVTYWFSLGLSMHRAHHMYPNLSWIDLKDYVEEAPSGWWFLPHRDIRP